MTAVEIAASTPNQIASRFIHNPEVFGRIPANLSQAFTKLAAALIRAEAEIERLEKLAIAAEVRDDR